MIRWYRRLLPLLLVVAALTTAPLARAEDPPRLAAVDVRVDVDTITVGDRIRLTYVARGVEGVTFEAPASPESLGLFEILDQQIGTPQRTPDGGTLLRVEFTVTAFQPGVLTVPGLALLYTEPGGERRSVVSPDMPIGVRSVLGNDPNPQLLDIKPPVTIPGAAVSYAESAATAMLVAAALAITVLMLRRQRNRPVFVPIRLGGPAFNPESAARAELDAIEASGLLERGNYEVYYQRISHCLRLYLEQRYEFPALSMTTSELRSALAAEGVDRWQARVITGLIEECDAVRWAGYAPAPARASRAIIQAHEVIEMMQRQPVEAAP